MAKASLNGMTPSRLRISLALFFLALCIPSILLIRQAYSELKWEALHQYRIQAEALTRQIDQQLQKLITREETRAFADYSFLNIAGETQANFLQRSPLASLPVQENIPGTLGYFQVDNEGNFSTPLLPTSKSTSQYGISREDARKRQEVHQQLFNVLKENRLSSSQPPAPAKQEEVVAQVKRVPASAAQAPMLSLSKPAPSDALNDSANISSADRTLGRSSSTREQTLKQSISSPSTEGKISQRVFDALESQQAESFAKKKLATSEVRKTVEKRQKEREQVLDKTDKEAGKRLREDKKDIQYAAKAPAVAEPLYRYSGKQSRKEISRLPAQSIAPATMEEDEAVAAPETKNARIETFESEIDPFQLSYLDSGHYVLFRKVWRDNQRYIQGLLIERDAFINGIIESTFKNTALYTMSNLIIRWDGKTISQLNGGLYKRYLSRSQTFKGEPLYQAPLSYPLTSMQLVYTINHLPDSPGVATINWLSGILFLVMALGFYLMYRSGMRQIALSNQQRDFVSAVSHELKTPLTSIRMYGEMLREGWTDEEKKKTYYDYIYEESERLTRLINNVLQLARFSRNKIQTDLQPIQCGSLLDMMKSRISSQAEKAGFELNINCGDNAANQTIQVDTDHFLQIMINLVDNAIKFSTHADNKIIEISCQLKQSNKIQIGVRDFGPGIPKDQMKKIFGLFYRAENELTRETVGTGIGLSLVNQLTREMNGSIDVRNANPGAEFTLVLPTT